MKLSISAAFACALISSASAHSWVERLSVIAPNGTMTGAPGFARGNVLRTAHDFSDITMTYLIPPDGRQVNDIQNTDLICIASQTTPNQTAGSPRLQAQAGANVALRYQENGHVTLPQNQPGKPPNRGTVFVYGTTQPSPSDTLLAIHRVWNAAGTGGDRRGVLLSTQNFDDGQCYQINNGNISEVRQKSFPHPADQIQGADLWCQQDIKIPSTAASGSPYTLYWVWDWPTLPGTPGFPQGKQEIYTTCMDIDIVGSNSTTAEKEVANQFVVGQNFGNAGISTQLANIANPTAVTGQFIPFSGVSGSAAPTATAPVGGNSNTLAPSNAATTTPVNNGGSATTETVVPVQATGQPLGAAGETITTSIFETEAVTQTAFITVTAQAKRQEATQSSSTKLYSKTEAAYRLRARNPFAVL